MSEHGDHGPPRLTATARQRLTEEVASLRAQRDELTASLGGGDPVGDSADQADALERATERSRIDQRIVEIDDLLARAEDAPADSGVDVVSVGAVVTVAFPDGTHERLRVGDLVEDDGETPVLTPRSPLGRALLGRRAGEHVTYAAPDGETQAHVVSIGASNG